MQPNIEDQSDLFAGAIPVSHLALPGSDRARKMTATSGRNFSELLESVSPIGYLRKMLLDTSTWASTKCLLTWKVKATPLNRLLFQLVPSMPRTEGIESGLWQTPVADDAVERKDGKVNSRGEPKLSAQVLWQTPNANEDRAENYTLETSYRHKQEGRQIHLAQEVRDSRLWPTPMKADDPRNGLWATPNTMDSLPPRSEEAMQKHMDHPKRRGQIKPENLRDQVKMFPTPTQRDHKDTGDCANVPKNSLLGREVEPSIEHGSLNPNFVEHLMGFPKNWTEV